jgi:hypothetical protein
LHASPNDRLFLPEVIRRIRFLVPPWRHWFKKARNQPAQPMSIVWFMVIPSPGFLLRALIFRCEPTLRSRFLKFITLYDPEPIPNRQSGQFGPAPLIEQSLSKSIQKK